MFTEKEENKKEFNIKATPTSCVHLYSMLVNIKENNKYFSVHNQITHTLDVIIEGMFEVKSVPAFYDYCYKCAKVYDGF